MRYRPPHNFGIGALKFGNAFEFATDEQVERTLSAAWDAGIRYFDVAPQYGRGLAERRLGRFLARKPRDEFVISSKVGRLLKAERSNGKEGVVALPKSPNTYIYDYTADGVKRSIEDSLQRMGLDHLDIVFVHDLSPDNTELPAAWDELWSTAQEGAFPTLTQLREEGVIDGWGMGVNRPEPILRCVEEADPDVHLLASQYSLLDHDTTVEQVFPAVRKQGGSLVVGSSLNAGFVAGAPRYNYGDYDAELMVARREKLRKVSEVCDRYGITPVAAALQFSLAPDVASALIVGSAKPEHVLSDFAAMDLEIPAALWTDLRNEGLVHPDAQIPSK